MRKRGLILFLILCAVLALDFFSKAYVSAHIPNMYQASPVFPYGGIAVFHDLGGIQFSIVHIINKGAAWGLFSSLQLFLVVLRIGVVLGLLLHLLVAEKWVRLPISQATSGWLRFLATPSALKPLSRHIPLALVSAGAMGNIVDFFIYGHVVDMFHFKFWNYTYPIFNCADSAIFCGIAWLLLLSIRDKRSAPLAS
jgi:signal peptidase II